MLCRNKRDDAWVFGSELIHVFLLCRNVPLTRKNGSSISFGDIIRIERHSFKVSFEPIETKIAYRIICGVDVIIRPRKNDESDTVVNDEAPVSSKVGRLSILDNGPSDLSEPELLDDSLSAFAAVDGADLAPADDDNEMGDAAAE